MRLNDCIIEQKGDGICPIDINIAIKTFTKRCYISKWQSNSSEKPDSIPEYKLVRVIYKKCFSMKTTISEKDAKILIKRLNLVEHKSELFNISSTFLMPGVDINNI